MKHYCGQPPIGQSHGTRVQNHYCGQLFMHGTQLIKSGKHTRTRKPSVRPMHFKYGAVCDELFGAVKRIVLVLRKLNVTDTPE